MDILRTRGVEFDIIEYLKTPVSESDIRRFLELLAVEPQELIHPGALAELSREVSDYNTPAALVGLLLEHPEVMNRPVVIRGDRAVIARPAEKVEGLLD